MENKDSRVVQIYQSLEPTAKKLNLTIDTNGSSFGIYYNKMLIFFCTSVDELFAFLKGYENAKFNLTKNEC